MISLPTIPGFELRQWLGGGPLTQVFAGIDTSTQQPVAVKVLREEWQGEPMAMALLRGEAVAGKSVQHPHLVRIHAAYLDGPPYFLVMELLPGETLRDRLRRDYSLDVATAVWIARQTAEALAALHRAGFIHGDLKPENIRLVDAGKVVVMDLGFARRSGDHAEFLNQGALLGTANYLAPERCALEPTIDGRADVFSLGVTLFEMVTGMLPYPLGTVTETLRAHRERPARDLSDVPGAWSLTLVRLLRRLLATRPADRPHLSAVVPELIRLEIATLRRPA
jgi:serine/threonine protein kinase